MNSMAALTNFQLKSYCPAHFSKILSTGAVAWLLVRTFVVQLVDLSVFPSSTNSKE